VRLVKQLGQHHNEAIKRWRDTFLLDLKTLTVPALKREKIMSTQILSIVLNQLVKIIPMRTPVNVFLMIAHLISFLVWH